MGQRRATEAMHDRPRISDTQGLHLISTDQQLRVLSSTPSAAALCNLQSDRSEQDLPASLSSAMREALNLHQSVFVWHATISGRPSDYRVQLTPQLDTQGTLIGYRLLLQEAVSPGAFDTLKLQNEMLNALVTTDWLLNTHDQWLAALPEALPRIGAIARFSRIQIFQKLLNGHRTARLTSPYRWDAGPLAPDDLATTDHFSLPPRWLQLLKRGQPIAGVRDELPVPEQQLLLQRQVDVFALVPVFSGKDWWGLISFEHADRDRPITQDQLAQLMMVARSLGVAVHRQLESERLEQARLAFDCTSEGIMICDDKKRITAVNKGFTEITGYTEEEALGRTPEILSSGKNSAEFYMAMWQAIIEDGDWRGEIWNRRKNGEIYPQWLTITSVKTRQGKVTHYVAVFADISEAKESQNRLHQLVNHDPLTGLPNRRLLNELLDRSLRHSDRKNQRIGLLFVDLDRFKSVNDTLGHHAGDLLLTSVTQRLTSSVRECDTIARLSGDEFIIMMDSLKQSDDAAIVARKVISALQQSFIIDGKEVFIGASIGISIYPEDGETANDLIKAADIAMYQAKHEGRNDFRFYTPSLGETVHERLTMDTMLRHALERQELVVHYQPQISLATGKIIGAEALLRWQHPEQGMISPGKFIPLAEETGLIIPIGEWVLRQAAHDLMMLEVSGYPLEWISVNVSAVQIHRSQFGDTVYGVLVETGCDPARLELEITESAIMNNVEYVIDVCRKLKGMGVRLALDDFGTGYSSLSYLKRFPLDKLKIDQSFVRDLPQDVDDSVISGAIIGLGHNLGLKVIAEGVEKRDQEVFLRERGCEEAQGYLYGRPVPIKTLLELLAISQSVTP